MKMADYFDLEEPASSDSSMKRLIALAREVIDTETLVGELEENLSDCKRRLNNLKVVQLPELMAECGVSEFKTDNGFKIFLDDFVSGSLPKDEGRRDEAIRWLEDNGAESLIKTEVNLQFEKSEHNRALSLIADLADQGYHVSSKMGIHPQTLIAHVKERLRRGDEVPLDLLGLYAGRTAKIKAPKK
jgi:hypothetical protein